MFFPHQRHNQAWQRADQLLPLRFSEEPAPGRTHPWQVIPAWTGRRARWTASLEPGLVNGIPAAMRVRVRELTAGQRARVEQDLLAQGRRLPEENARVDVFLDERPAVDLLWRRIGTGAQGTVREQDGELVVQQEPVPEFFKRLGVQDASTSALGYEATATQGVRYLAASDLVLNQPRVSVQTQVVVESAIGGSLTSVVPVYRVPPDLQAHVVVFPKFQPPEPPTLTPRDVFFNPFQDLPLDQLHLATVYALSPWNPPMEDIDGNWTIYVHQRVHWNVAHATRIPETARAERLTLFTGLAAGIGDTLFNFILSNNNDFTQAALNLATSSRTQGRMYAV